MIFSAKELWLINQATELSVLHAEVDMLSPSTY